jgi:hypothetical protein
MGKMSDGERMQLRQSRANSLSLSLLTRLKMSMVACPTTTLTLTHSQTQGISNSHRMAIRNGSNTTSAGDHKELKRDYPIQKSKK